MKKELILIFLFLIFTVSISAQDFDHVITNSENWKDVYSALHYANLEGVEGDFLTSTAHGNIMANSLKKDKDIRVITSDNDPYVFNYPGLLISSGFEDADEIVVDDANLELIDELPSIRNFIVVDDSYGYGAISVIPYARLTDSWVFLANDINIQEIDSILSQRNIDNLIIYGFVEREIRDTLDKYDPEIIDNSDRFEDNIEIVEKFLDITPVKQIILTNGEFIEKELMEGQYPIIFTGKENVPDQIGDYLKNSEIEIGILIGNDLIGTATNIRRTTGISVMVKFARGARTQTTGVSSVEGLDLFPVPTPFMQLTIDSIKYNTVTSQLEVTYKSESNIPLYLIGTITINSGQETLRVGDTEAIFITPGNFKTITYPELEFESLEDISAEIYTIYGETEKSLDRAIQATVNVDVVEVLDRCEIDLEKIRVRYNKQLSAFTIKMKNIGSVDCWVNLEIEDVVVGYIRETIGTESPVRIPAGKTETIKIEKELTDEDLEKNSRITLVTNYGERETGLVKSNRGVYDLEIVRFTQLTYVIGVIVIILILLIIWFIIKRRRDEDDDF